MIRPVGTSKKAQYYQAVYDSIMRRRARPSPGFLTSVTTRGTFRTPVFPLRRAKEEDEGAFQLTHTLPWSGDNTYWQMPMPEVLINGIWVGASFGEFNYGPPQSNPNDPPFFLGAPNYRERLSVDSSFGNPYIGRHPQNTPTQELVKYASVRTRTFRKKTGSVKFQGTNSMPFFDIFSGNPFVGTGFVVSLFTIPSLPTELAPITETDYTFSGQSYTIEQLQGFDPDEPNPYVFAYFDGTNRAVSDDIDGLFAFAPNVSNQTIRVIKPRGGSNPKGIYQIDSRGGFQRIRPGPIAQKSSGRVFFRAPFGEQQIGAWVPASIPGFHFASENVNGPKAFLLIDATKTAVEHTIDISSLVEGQLFYFVITYGQHPAPQSVGYNHTATMGLTITNL